MLEAISGLPNGNLGRALLDHYEQQEDCQDWPQGVLLCFSLGRDGKEGSQEDSAELWVVEAKSHVDSECISWNNLEKKKDVR